MEFTQMKIKKIFRAIIFICINIQVWSIPNMKDIPGGTVTKENVTISVPSFYVSETKITVGDWKEYLKISKVSSIENFERNACRVIDTYNAEIQDDYPVWGITWVEAILYCNWLSEQEGREKCYSYENDKNKVKIDYGANGYRLPNVKEWLYISEIYQDKPVEYYNKVNTIGLTIEKNPFIEIKAYPVKNMQKNFFGLYDVLGNLPEFCNDYYNENFSFKDFTSHPYGPKDFTPDLDEIYFYGYPLYDVRCISGGYYYNSFAEIKQMPIEPVSVVETEYCSFRVVKNKS